MRLRAAAGLYDTPSIAVARILGDGKRATKNLCASCGITCSKTGSAVLARQGMKPWSSWPSQHHVLVAPASTVSDDLNARLENNASNGRMRFCGVMPRLSASLMRDLDALGAAAYPTMPARRSAAGDVDPWSASPTITRCRSPAETRFRSAAMSTRSSGCGAEVIARHQRSYEKADGLRSDALPAAAGLARWTRRPAAGLGPARGVCHPAPAAGSPHGVRRASANTSRFCGSLRPSRWRTVGLSNSRWNWARSATMRSSIWCFADREALPRLDIYPYLPKALETTKPASYILRRCRHDRYTAVLLQHHLKKLRLPTFLGEYSKLAPNALLRRRITSSIYCGSAR